jgi:sec-independent protein translocase protein TatA
MGVLGWFACLPPMIATTRHGGGSVRLTKTMWPDHGPNVKGYDMQMGPWQLLLIAVVVLVLFGRGKVSSLMGEVGKGITAFKRGVKDSTEEIEKDVSAASPAVKDVTPSENDKV